MYTPGYIKREKQYTKGREYMFNGNEYVGYYNTTAHGLYTGKVFTKTSQRIHIIEYVENEQSQIYAELAETKGIVTDLEFDDPVGTEIAPTNDDYKLGHFIRYFIQQRNDRQGRIREIDKDQYKALADSATGLNPNYYKAVTVRWKLTGPEHDKIKNSRITIPGIEDTNRRSVEEREFRMPGIATTLQNRLLEFSRFAPLRRDTNTDIQL